MRRRVQVVRVALHILQVFCTVAGIATAAWALHQVFEAYNIARDLGPLALYLAKFSLGQLEKWLKYSTAVAVVGFVVACSLLALAIRPHWRRTCCSPRISHVAEAAASVCMIVLFAVGAGSAAAQGPCKREELGEDYCDDITSTQAFQWISVALFLFTGLLALVQWRVDASGPSPEQQAVQLKGGGRPPRQKEVTVLAAPANLPA